MHVIGFGAVGQAFYKLLLRLLADKVAGTEQLRSVAFYAPELTEKSVEVVCGVTLSKAPCGAVERGTLSSVLDSLGSKPGDVLLELATRIDTPTIWAEAKKRGLHFANSGFDCWPDVELDLEALDELKKHSDFNGSSGRTSIFSFGMNPGVVSHFVSYGLAQATGIEDVGKAAEAFGLRSAIFTGEWASGMCCGSANAPRSMPSPLVCRAGHAVAQAGHGE